MPIVSSITNELLTETWTGGVIAFVALIPYLAIVFKDRVNNMNRCRSGLIQRDVDSVCGKSKNKAVLNIQILTGKEADAVYSRANSVEPKVSENHYI